MRATAFTRLSQPRSIETPQGRLEPMNMRRPKCGGPIGFWHCSTCFDGAKGNRVGAGAFGHEARGLLFRALPQWGLEAPIPKEQLACSRLPYVPQSFQLLPLHRPGLRQPYRP
jgi:hypothetical protein